MATSNLPTRSRTVDSDDGALGAGDPSNTAGLLTERLQAWKHMTAYLEDYISAVAKEQHGWAKDHEKHVMKTLSSPLKEPQHFDTALGGVTGLFENLRANTQAQINLYTETSKNLTGTVLPVLERLHAEIKNKTKEIGNGAGKGAKAVDSARSHSQKHMDLLAQQASHFDSTRGRVNASHDPYVLKRGVLHRLNKQLLEENNNRQDLIAVQTSFSQFEAHVLQTVQATLNSYNQFMSGQADRLKAMYGDIAATSSNIPLDFEWNNFVNRNSNVLINPNTSSRSMNDVSFPNENHRSTKPLIEGTLERKSRGMGALKGYSTGFYALTPAGFLHEYKDNENFHKDPSPEHSLYLPDCIIGATDGTNFTIKGKDSSGSKIGQKMSMSSEYQFRAHTNSDAEQWHSVISSFVNGGGSLPTSPVESRNLTPIHTRMDESQTQGVTSGPTPTSATAPHSGYPTSGTAPTSAHPMSATSANAPTSAGGFAGGQAGPGSHLAQDAKYVER